MANAFTSTDSGSLGTSLIQTAYDRAVGFALRDQPLFRAFADVEPMAQTAPGSTVVLQRYTDMAETTTALTEDVDPDAVAIGNTVSVTLTLAERGNVALLTRKLQLFNIAKGGIDGDVVDIVAENMAKSLDTVAQTAFRAGTNVIREASASRTLNTGTAVTVTGTDYAQARDFLAAVTKLRGNSARPRYGSRYAAIISPEVSYDLRTQTGQAGWLTPQENGASQARLWDGYVGAFGGAEFIESPRCYSATDGASSARVRRSYVFGRQAFMEGQAEAPHVVVGPVTDKLKRFQPIGWYGVLGYGIYRQEAVYRIETASSL